MKVIPEERHAQKFDVHVWVLQLLYLNEQPRNIIKISKF
jgi:hypothetical protein